MLLIHTCNKSSHLNTYSIVDFSNKVYIQGPALFATTQQKHEQEGLLITVVVIRVLLSKVSISLVGYYPFKIMILQHHWSILCDTLNYKASLLAIDFSAGGLTVQTK